MDVLLKLLAAGRNAGTSAQGLPLSFPPPIG
jgi:hypothetical protein